MKKMFILVVLIVSAFALIGCSQQNKVERNNRGWHVPAELSIEGNFLDNLNARVLGGTLVNFIINIDYPDKDSLYLRGDDVDFIEIISVDKILFQRKPVGEGFSEKEIAGGNLSITLVIKTSRGYNWVSMVKK